MGFDGGISDTEVVTGTAEKDLLLIGLRHRSDFTLPGSDNDECRSFPLLPFAAVTAADDSLLLVDEHDIRELSSPRKPNDCSDLEAILFVVEPTWTSKTIISGERGLLIRFVM
jgi:hypothetical protein